MPPEETEAAGGGLNPPETRPSAGPLGGWLLMTGEEVPSVWMAARRIQADPSAMASARGGAKGNSAMAISATLAKRFAGFF
jgi:hypothetical protein